MANKALSKRQKLMIQAEPVKAVTSRNPVKVAARQHAAGLPQKTGAAEHQPQKRLIEKLLSRAAKE